MGTGLTPEETASPLQDVVGRVCVSCRTVFPLESTAARCPLDGGVLLDTRAVVESGDDPMLGRTVAGRFTVVARLGGGSMGTVYRARQEAMGRDVALKILRQDRAFDSQAKARFEREARANSVLVSPHTVTAFDFGEAEDGSLYLAMEMLEGESLGQRIRREGRVPPREAVRVAREAASSLAEAHKKGIIHRDIKPDNVFLTRAPGPNGGEPAIVTKVLDFGIAKMLREEQGVSALETQAGTVFGTPRYMSPEQAQGKPLDARSDLYSLGVILYQMLAGRPPFEDEDAVVVMARHIKSPPPPFSESAPDLQIPGALEGVVRRALSKDPDDRPRTAEHFVIELDAAMSGWVAGAARPSGDNAPTEQVPSIRGRKRSVTVVVAAVAVVVVALIGVRVFRAPPSSAPAAAPPPPASTPSAVAAPPTPPPPSASSDGAIPLDALPSADEPKKKKDRDRGTSSPKPPADTPTKPKYGRFE
jgi:serine/threonine-protein kinase